MPTSDLLAPPVIDDSKPVSQQIGPRIAPPTPMRKGVLAKSHRGKWLLATSVGVVLTIGAAFYLFGFVLFMNLATIGNTIDSSKTPLGYYILQNFLLQCAVAANAFFVFLVLPSSL